LREAARCYRSIPPPKVVREIALRVVEEFRMTVIAVEHQASDYAARYGGARTRGPDCGGLRRRGCAGSAVKSIADTHFLSSMAPPD
jgi:hypothetical protein